MNRTLGKFLNIVDTYKKNVFIVSDRSLLTQNMYNEKSLG